MTNPTPEDFFEAANLLQDVASQYRPVAISSNQSDTDLLAEAVRVIEKAKRALSVGAYNGNRTDLEAFTYCRDFLAKLGR